MENKTLNIRKPIAYIVLIILTFLCLFFFFILIINCTRSHNQIQAGFSFFPGKSFVTNLHHVLNDAKLPVLSGIKNSLHGPDGTGPQCSRTGITVQSRYAKLL